MSHSEDWGLRVIRVIRRVRVVSVIEIIRVLRVVRVRVIVTTLIIPPILMTL